MGSLAQSCRDGVGRRVGAWLARFLSRPSGDQPQSATCSCEALAMSIVPGDVLLVDGTTRISTAIKYLTQSTWSHAAIYVGHAIDQEGSAGLGWLVEADIQDGVRLVPLEMYATSHTRICRARNLADTDRDRVVAYVLQRVGHAYDLRNVVDLARYLFPTPPVPVAWRRRLIALGSGDPTRAICSTLVAQAFQSVRYPILPHVSFDGELDSNGRACAAEILRIRHHSLFAPRDFDISPYFEVVKPTLTAGFDYRNVRWAPDT